MKKIIQFALLLAFVATATSSFAQKKIKEGVVKFELADTSDESPEMAMLSGTTMDFYFTEKNQRMDMSMMGGMMRIQTFVPNNNPKDGSILMDMMGQKIQIIEISEEELGQTNGAMNFDNLEEVVYDEKDTREIAGYKCYKANTTMKGGQKMSYYITEKISPPAPVKNKSGKSLKGYPLEMAIDTGQGFTMTFKAVEVSGKIEKDSFTVPEGYKKMTMEDFQKEMGGMNFGIGN